MLPPLQHPLHLGFSDASLEQAFQTHTLQRTLIQGRLAVAIGGLLYVLMGVLDHWFVPPQLQAQIWLIRLGTVWVMPLIFALSYVPRFAVHCHLLLAFSALVGGLGFIATIHILPLEAVPYYFPGLLLVSLYAYNFCGTRFIYAFLVDLSLLLIYCLSLAWSADVPAHVLFSHAFLLIAANLMGGSAGYLGEYQRRMLFLQRRKLEAERQMHLQRSLHDSLTGLPNRELLYDRISQALSLAQREGVNNAGFFIDLDDFKQINDRFGHETGDRVLKLVAQRLREVVREADTVSRLAGDEFFVLARGVDGRDEARQLAAKMLACIVRPSSELPVAVRLSGSVGVCLFPYQGASVAGIIDQADQAMYVAKRSGKSAYAIAGEAEAG